MLTHTYVVTQHIRAFENCDMIKLTFNLSSRAFSNVQLSFFNCEVCGIEEYDYLIPFGVPTLVCGKAPALPTIAFTLCTNVNIMKKAHNIIIVEMVLVL